MGSMRVLYGDNFPPENEFMGVITGTFALTQLPNIPGKMFRLKAFSINTGSIWLGNARSTGSVPRLPWQYPASYDSDWFPAFNLNQYFMAGASGSCYLGYWVIG